MSNDFGYNLEVGESVNVKSGVFATSFKVVYTGMINHSTYTLAIIGSFGHNSYAYNLFLPMDQKRVALKKGHLTVLSVSESRIHFNFQK